MLQDSLALQAADALSGRFDPLLVIRTWRSARGVSSDSRCRPDRRHSADDQRPLMRQAMAAPPAPPPGPPSHPATTHKLAWSGDGRRLRRLPHRRLGPGRSAAAPCPAGGPRETGAQRRLQPRGDVLISTAWDNTTRLWDSGRGRPLLREVPGNFLALSAEGRRPATSRGGRGTVRGQGSNKRARAAKR
jgi:hypothetical protein